MISFLLSLPLLLGQVEPPESWKRLEVKEAGFRVALPNTWTESTQKVATAVGTREVKLFIAEGRGESSYVTSWCDWGVREKGKDDTRLDHAREGAVNASRGKLRSEKKLTLGDCPARELVIDGPQASVIRLRLVLVDSKLVQLMVLSDGSAGQTKDASTFFDSFNLLPTGIK